MADIKLVIKIPEEVYEKIQERKVNQYDIDDICQSVFEGKTLPKGHGDLIDKSKIKIVELEDSLHCLRWEQGSGIDLRIEADTIIETDKESE